MCRFQMYLIKIVSETRENEQQRYKHVDHWKGSGVYYSTVTLL